MLVEAPGPLGIIDNSRMPVRPIFVVGSPRSGTTMIGNYIGSARSVLNAGEYRALYLTIGTLPFQMVGQLSGLVPPDWEPHRLEYIKEAQQHACEYIVRVAEAEGKTAFCDSSPRNILIADRLAEIFPDALFVLTVRHYTGAIQSLTRLNTIRVLPGYEPSIDWVDPTAVAAAMIWSKHYRRALDLPAERTVVFGYDRFCADPEPVLIRFKGALAGAGFPVEELDDAVFAVSHAHHPDTKRPTVGQVSSTGPRLASISSYDASAWLPATEAEVEPVVTLTNELLGVWFPDDYAAPAGYPAG
jgi:Sulfotransferase family